MMNKTLTRAKIAGTLKILFDLYSIHDRIVGFLFESTSGKKSSGFFKGSFVRSEIITPSSSIVGTGQDEQMVSLSGGLILKSKRTVLPFF